MEKINLVRLLRPDETDDCSGCLSSAVTRRVMSRFMARPMSSYSIIRSVFLCALLLLLAGGMDAATRRKRHHAARHQAPVAAKAPVKAASAGPVTIRKVVATRLTPASRTTPPVIRGGPWTQPTYADSTAGDNVDGEELEVRRAAVEALGPYNGSVVAVDPSNGRILTIVNQKLALGSGFQPCSTIKVSVALSALRENVIESRNTRLRTAGGRIDLTYALAHSNNLYFATLGQKLGFERVSRYAHLFGYGETAGFNIPGETAGHYPAEPPRNGGVGMLTSFGEEIRQTPLQLAALMSAIANGGTLYYLQYPRTREDLVHFEPKVKRQLDIAPLIPVVRPGLEGAVNFGTARRAQQDEVIAGKTGTCTESQTHLGWFGSYNGSGHNKVAVVVLLTGGRPAIGPAAAGVAGEVFRLLARQNYFARGAAPPAPMLPAELLSAGESRE